MVASWVEKTVSRRPGVKPGARNTSAAVEHPDIGAHPERDAAGMRADDAAAEDDDLGGDRPRARRPTRQYRAPFEK
jgi:hypothetical protein